MKTLTATETSFAKSCRSAVAELMGDDAYLTVSLAIWLSYFATYILRGARFSGRRSVGRSGAILRNRESGGE